MHNPEGPNSGLKLLTRPQRGLVRVSASGKIQVQAESLSLSLYVQPVNGCCMLKTCDRGRHYKAPLRPFAWPQPVTLALAWISPNPSSAATADYSSERPFRSKSPPNGMAPRALVGLLANSEPPRSKKWPAAASAVSRANSGHFVALLLSGIPSHLPGD